MKVSMLQVALGTLFVRSMDRVSSSLYHKFFRLSSSLWSSSIDSVGLFFSPPPPQDPNEFPPDFDPNMFKFLVPPQEQDSFFDNDDDDNNHFFTFSESSPFAASAEEELHLEEDALLSLNELRKSVMQHNNNNLDQATATPRVPEVVALEPDQNRSPASTTTLLPPSSLATENIAATTITIAPPGTTAVSLPEEIMSSSESGGASVQDLYQLIDQFDEGEVEEQEVEALCDKLGLKWDNFKTLFLAVEAYKAGSMEEEDFFILSKSLGFQWNQYY